MHSKQRAKSTGVETRSRNTALFRPPFFLFRLASNAAVIPGLVFWGISQRCGPQGAF